MSMLFGGSPPAPPKPPDPTPMPDLMDPAVLAAQRKQQQTAIANSGRLSTILTGDSYSNDKLGTR